MSKRNAEDQKIGVYTMNAIKSMMTSIAHDKDQVIEVWPMINDGSLKCYLVDSVANKVIIEMMNIKEEDKMIRLIEDVIYRMIWKRIFNLY